MRGEDELCDEVIWVRDLNCYISNHAPKHIIYNHKAKVKSENDNLLILFEKFREFFY